MSEPQGWQQPKTNWGPPDAPTGPDFNRIEGNANAIESGNRTVDPAQVPVGNVGTLRQLLDRFANRLAGIIGGNWWDAPAASLATLWAKFNAATGHKHTGGANDAPPIPLNGLDAAAKTTAGGSEAGRLSVTDANGGVGRANAVKDANGTYRTATGPGGWGVSAQYMVPLLDANGRVGDTQRFQGKVLTDLVAADGSVAMTGTLQAPSYAVIDTRDVVTTPASYNKQVTVNFKTLIAMGLNGIANGIYCTVWGLRGWSDDSGGKATEIALTDSGMYYRTGTVAAGWAPWGALWHDGNAGGTAPNNAVQLVKALLQEADTRASTFTYTNGNLTGVTIKDGAATVKTGTVNYTSGNVSSIVEVVGGKTITTTLTYNPDGSVSGQTRSVV